MLSVADAAVGCLAELVLEGRNLYAREDRVADLPCPARIVGRQVVAAVALPAEPVERVGIHGRGDGGRGGSRGGAGRGRASAVERTHGGGGGRDLTRGVRTDLDARAVGVHRLELESATVLRRDAGGGEGGEDGHDERGREDQNHLLHWGLSLPRAVSDAGRWVITFCPSF
ncbi:TPA: hypothetical protein DDZ10_04945 [Candidatus Uhrbacteria bacterium]|nr:hypothetical protein [Candidatus Uhrbacteria bacterium]